MKRKKAIAIWIVIVLLINILPFSSAYAENSNEVDVLAVVTNSAESEAESLEVNAEEYFAQDGVDSLEFSGDDERSPVEDKQGEDESVIHIKSREQRIQMRMQLRKTTNKLLLNQRRKMS